jgi:hypothetical protein
MHRVNLHFAPALLPEHDDGNRQKAELPGTAPAMAEPAWGRDETPADCGVQLKYEQ